MIKKTFGLKLGLVVLGVFLAFLLVEMGFRIAGGLLSVAQEIRNRQGLAREGTYRILCLGESTTQGQWPPFLQEELDKSDSGIKFKVIDKGIAGTFTGVLLSRLDRNLDTFNPQMVVVMMGINDGEWVWKNPVEYDGRTSAQWVFMLKNLRANKLARYIIDGLKNRAAGRKKADFEKENIVTQQGTAGEGSKDPQTYLTLGNQLREKGSFEEAERVFEAGLRAFPKHAWLYLNLGNLYREIGEYEKAERAYKAGIRADPKNPWPYQDLGDLYREKGDVEKAERMHRAGLKVAPDNPWLYHALGDLYREKGDIEKAERTYKAGIKAAPENPGLYGALGKLYSQNGGFEKAERMYAAGIKADPKHSGLYLELGNLYREIGEHEKAERMYKAGINANPKHTSYLHLELGTLWNLKGKREKAERMLEAGIRTNSVNPLLYLELGDLWRLDGKREKAERMYEKALETEQKELRVYLQLTDLYVREGKKDKVEEVLRRSYEAMGNNPRITGAMSLFSLQHKYGKRSFPTLATIRNYQKLRDIVLKKGLLLVCMQYPMRDVGSLEKILGTDKRIIYVENRRNFEEALKTQKRTDIFRDMIGGDFGHCTDMGNKIIAKNLSTVILREVLGKN